jgi:ABC-type dipeptide/oligopeptide/nickel transport system ATPase subunit
VFPSRGRWLSARAFEYELTSLLVAGMPLSTHQSGSMLGVSGFTGCGKTDVGRYFAVVGEIVSKEVCVVKTRSRVGCSAM